MLLQVGKNAFRRFTDRTGILLRRHFTLPVVLDQSFATAVPACRKQGKTLVYQALPAINEAKETRGG
jgi:hypothetical protein